MPEVRLCRCGGEMYLDSFDHPKKPVEWLMRCSDCGKFDSVTNSPEGSIAASIEEAKRDPG